MRARLCGLAVVAAVAGCGGETPPVPGPPAGPPPSPGAAMTLREDDEAATTTAPSTAQLPGLPAWTAGYLEWTRLNAEPIPPRESDPHLSTKNVYASEEIAGAVYPEGTVIVKEGVRPGTNFVGLVATMRKVERANPAHADWVFTEWTRESPEARFTLLARGAVCESCHSGVAEQDYVFTRQE